jgi:hypothetical protein
MAQTVTSTRPMNVIVDHDSRAAKIYRDWATVLAPGLPPTPDHDLIYRGGKIIANLTFTNFYLGGQQAWQASDIQSIDQALAASMSDRNLNNVMVQYFTGGSITSTFIPSSVLPGPPPSSVNQTDVESVVRTLYSNGQLKGSDRTSTVFNFMLPRGTVLSDQTGGAHKGSPRPRKHHMSQLPKDEADSLHGLGGYHGSIHVSDASGTQETVYYAVGVYSERQPDGTVNGIPVFDAPWKNVVATFYHELNEARTDADVEDAIKAGNGASLVGWVSKEGEECGDFPVFEANPLTQVFQEVPLTDGSGTVPIQFMYSNAVHGPEGPIPNPH